ncbi:MAG: GNAT family N-acetyltransferase [Planctomycetota bacterium]
MFPTRRLEVLPATVEMLRAEREDRPGFSKLLRARIPASWPPELYNRQAADYTLAKLRENPAQEGWWAWYVLRKPAGAQGRTLIGICGFKGPPGADGTVEVGYGILPEFRRLGYATEATRGMIDRAFSQPGVSRVVAETLPELRASQGVLRRIGFRLLGPGSEEGTLRYELRRAPDVTSG